MLLKGIDLPEILLRAQEAGELVVFAGAGISFPPPSNLPLFDELALQIGKHAGLTMEMDEPADHHLGRLKHKGIDVHQESARIGEGNEMGCWSFSLGRFFPDAVKLTVSMKGIITFEHTPIFLRLDEKKELIRNYPDAAADFILFYLQCPLKFFSIVNTWEVFGRNCVNRLLTAKS